MCVLRRRQRLSHVLSHALVHGRDPKASCVACEADAAPLAAFIEGVGGAQALARKSVRSDAAMQFDTERTVNVITEALERCCAAANVSEVSNSLRRPNTPV